MVAWGFHDEFPADVIELRNPTGLPVVVLRTPWRVSAKRLVSSTIW